MHIFIQISLLLLHFVIIFQTNSLEVYFCLGHFIIDAKSSYSPDIQQKITELQNTWDDLLELANARKEALAGAKQVHLFDQTAEEIMSWIKEKDTDVIYGVYVPDVEVFI